MSTKKIPDKSNFLEKFAAVEGLLQGKSGQFPELGNKKIPAPEDSRPAIEVNPTSGSELKCPNCGGPRTSENVFCGSCGHSFTDMPRSKTVDNGFNNNSSPPVLKCSSCGTVHNADDVFCEACGNRL